MKLISVDEYNSNKFKIMHKTIAIEAIMLYI